MNKNAARGIILVKLNVSRNVKLDCDVRKRVIKTEEMGVFSLIYKHQILAVVHMNIISV